MLPVRCLRDELPLRRANRNVQSDQLPVRCLRDELPLRRAYRNVQSDHRWQYLNSDGHGLFHGIFHTPAPPISTLTDYVFFFNVVGRLAQH